MQDQGARKRGSEKSRQGALVWPKVEQKGAVHRARGTGTAVRSPTLLSLCPSPSSVSAFSSYTFLCLSCRSAYSGTPGPSEEGCCNEDGALSHAVQSSPVGPRGSHGDEAQQSVGVRVSQAGWMKRARSRAGLCPEQLAGSSSGGRSRHWGEKGDQEKPPRPSWGPGTPCHHG